jgi:tetratricopeptide (TPR) repeat protein
MKLLFHINKWLIHLCILFLISPLTIASDSKQLIVGYDFDDELFDVGPDTYQIFKHTHGIVGLSSTYKFSGKRSLKIQDVAQDGGFPELQGYFETITEGKLYFHFAFMVVDINQNFNIALAGKSHFTEVKDGIGFWLDNDEGYLRHYIDHEPVNLFPLQPFVWYQLDLNYDITQGRYSLNIQNEYGEVMVDLSDQMNAVNEPGSTVNMFSFIGDLEDQQNAAYYVDDVLLYTQQTLNQTDFVAPGRRKLFIDIWDEYHKKLYGKIQCLPGVQSMDFGIDTDVFTTLLQNGYSEILYKLLETSSVEPGSWQSNPYLSALYSYQKGCVNMNRENWQQAIKDFSKAKELVSNARIYPLSLALAYAGANDYRQSDAILSSIQSDWINEQRFFVAYAMIGIHREDLYRARYWLSDSAISASRHNALEILRGLQGGILDDNMITKLKSYDPENWPQYLEQAVITEQYYFSLLWDKNYSQALFFTKNILQKLEALDIKSSKWLERAGDAAFYSKDYHAAITYYKSALEDSNACYCNYLKLADAYYVLGDALKEREYREKIYGRFEETN